MAAESEQEPACESYLPSHSDRRRPLCPLNVIALLDAAIFNVIVGNADAHGKNFSILYRSGSPRLAPLYDLLCTAYYRDLSKSFAMKIGKRATHLGLCAVSSVNHR